MEHRPYPKIPKRASDEARARPSPDGVWVATEKIHGANLGVATDGASVRIGKRKAFLADDEPFFGWQLLRAELGQAARAIHRALGGGDVWLYGELFGGAYPHPDVAAFRGLDAVQTGIWYAPDIRFALFDVVHRDTFLAHAEVEALAADHGLFVVPLLARGPRAALETLPVRFPSRVARLLGLPPLEGNVAEGFVLKPDVRAHAEERIVSKWKIPELDDTRFDESVPFALDGVALARFAERMVNPARLASARSKVGVAPSAIVDEVILDVLVDLEATFPRAFAALDADAEETLRAHVASLAARYG